MYLLEENPFLSDPNINKVRVARSALEFLVVQDIFLTETAEFADVVLPASSYLEKEGTGERFNTDDGLAHLVLAQWLPAKELPNADYPLVLNTGRLLEHWHTGSMTRRSYALDAIAPQAEVYVHPQGRRRPGAGAR